MESVLEMFEKKQENIKKNEFWDFGNSVLYDMCEENSKHKDVGVVIGKMWLIGRSYAASLERTKTGSKGDGFYEYSLANFINDNDLDLDSIVNEVKDIKTAITAHKKLIDLFKNITGKENRSFFSKYLHFHCRDIVYIYDERARKAINSIIKEVKDDLKDIKQSDEIKGLSKCEGDREYMSFCEKVLLFQEYLIKKEKINEYLKPREIDNFLLCYYKEKGLK